MKTTKIIAFIIALLWISRIDLAAQEKEHIGERIRVTAPTIFTSRLTGTLVALNGDTLFCQVEGSTYSTPVAIPLTAITRFEVNHGKGSRGRSALVGSAIGLCAALPATLIVINLDGEGMSVNDFVAGSLFLGAGGIVLGSGVGSLFPRERWEDIQVDRIHMKMLPPAKAQERESKKGIVFIAGGIGVGNTMESSKNRNGINSALRLGFNLARSFSMRLAYEINARNDEKPLSTDFVKIRRPKVLSTRFTLITAQANLRKGLFISTSTGLGVRRIASYRPVFGAIDPITRTPTIAGYEGSFSSQSGLAVGLSAGYELIRLRAFSLALEGTYRQCRGEPNSRKSIGLQGLISLSL